MSGPPAAVYLETSQVGDVAWACQPSPEADDGGGLQHRRGSLSLRPGSIGARHLTHAGPEGDDVFDPGGFADREHLMEIMQRWAVVALGDRARLVHPPATPPLELMAETARQEVLDTRQGPRHRGRWPQDVAKPRHTLEATRSQLLAFFQRRRSRLALLGGVGREIRWRLVQARGDQGWIGAQTRQLALRLQCELISSRLRCARSGTTGGSHALGAGVSCGRAAQRCSSGSACCAARSRSRTRASCG